ncbi:LysR family transcriptional regulator [Peristeroidobacter soli]|uniref:LysR family transcriptional regulator n=1 Tax=Peristeroidobacter soli TaxID=2497877 RepID=UPI00101D13B6|nr:LysR family transcriptional regulator [Peristeroidobacter soli]
MKLDGVAAFIAVADTGSVNEAARRLRLSKSAVSERLTELERALGAHLIQRNSRQLALTEDGLAFLQRAKRIIAEADAAAAELAHRRGEITGPLRISAPRGFGDTHLGPALHTFMERYPEVSVIADYDDRIGDAAGGYDAVIRIAQGEMPKLVTQTLTVSRRTLVASPSYLAQYGRPGTIEDLAQHQAIHYMERHPDDWSFRSGTDLLVARVAPRLRITSCLAMRDAAIAGLGIASLPTFHSHQAIKSGALEILDIGADPDVTPIVIAHQNDMRPSAKLTALIEHLKLAFGNPPYWDDGLPL